MYGNINNLEIQYFKLKIENRTKGQRFKINKNKCKLCIKSNFV